MNSNGDQPPDRPDPIRPDGDLTHETSAAMLPFILSGMVAIAAIGAVVWLWLHDHQPPVGRSAVSEPLVDPPKLDEITLTERSGQEFLSSDMRGDVWVASFFFTTCAGSCEKLNRNIAAMQRDEALSGVRWVSITVDPDNDSLEALSRYADRFEADPKRWLFCRGSMEYTESLGKGAFKLPVAFKGHNDFGVVIDRGGRVRNWLNINSRRDRVKLRELLMTCLEEPAPTDDLQPVGPAPESAGDVPEESSIPAEQSAHDEATKANAA